MLKNEITVGQYVRIVGGYSGMREARVREIVKQGVLVEMAGVTDRQRARYAALGGDVPYYQRSPELDRQTFQSLRPSTADAFAQARLAAENDESHRDQLREMTDEWITDAMLSVESRLASIEEEERELQQKARDAHYERTALRDELARRARERRAAAS